MASSTKIVCLVLVCMVLGTVVPDVEGAISCGTVVSKLLPCLTYLKGGAGPSAQCCSGVKAVNALATTTPDRQTTCGCLKNAAASYRVSGGSASALPGKCGVSIPYKISPSTDCSKVK